MNSTSTGSIPVSVFGVPKKLDTPIPIRKFVCIVVLVIVVAVIAVVGSGTCFHQEILIPCCHKQTSMTRELKEGGMI